MAGNPTFLKSETTMAWLGQFTPADQPTAVALLRAMTLVSRDMFAERLRRLVLQRVKSGNIPVGLYVERELRQRNGVPFKLFKESRGKVKRAFGVGPPPVQPTQSYDADVGSEGLVAHLVSELCREHPGQIFNQPGPDQIRKNAIRRFILVTDYVGSGKRARTYIEAAWRVRSVRSWFSSRATKGMTFEVIAYAASKTGRHNVESHPSRPAVHVAITCPTIDRAFSYSQQSEIRSLCVRYTAARNHSIPPLGFGSVGALIAFAHGAPNNTPAILHKGSSAWLPLFPARVTSATRAGFGVDDDKAATIRERLSAMRQKHLAKGDWVATTKPHARSTLMVMAALSQRPRHVEAVSARTELTIIDVEQALRRALSHGWIDGRNRLTEEGHGQLAHARKKSESISPLPPEPDDFYYPSSLRAPSGGSS
jgi:hypothetical protein